MLNLGLTELYQILTPDWSAKSINISETKNIISSYLTLNVTSQVRKQFYSEDLEQTSGWMLINVSSILAFLLKRFSVFVLNLMMEICPPTNRSHEEDSKAFLKVGEIVGVAKYSSKQRTNTSNKNLYSLFLIHSFN